MKKTMPRIFILSLVITSLFFSPSALFAEDEAPTTKPEQPADSVLFNVRYQDLAVFSGTITLPTTTEATLSDSSGILHAISPISTLYLLSLADATSSAFSITDLRYSPTYNSFYINCINIASTTPIHACGNWQYGVNNAYPFVGSDKYNAAKDDTIYFYFGNPRQFSVSATSTNTETPVIVTAEKYDFTSNIWLPLSGEVVNATQPDPSNPWSPFIIASSTTSETGTATIFLPLAGTYNIGLSTDGYYPKEIKVSTSKDEEQTPPKDNQQTGGSGSSGGSVQNPQPAFNTDKAIQYLLSPQQKNIVLGDSLLTDWTAIALASINGNSAEKDEIRSAVLKETNIVSVQDYQRHAMALMALGVNPYSDTPINYIQKIVDSYGEIKETDYYNDDIFSLFPLLRAGYNSQDQIIKDTVATIITKSSQDNWNSGGVDIAAAGIQALSQVQDINNVPEAIRNAKKYLKSESVRAEGGFKSRPSDSTANSESTSWALQAIAVLTNIDGASDTWSQNGITPHAYLASLQEQDGSIKHAVTSTKIWATSYAIPAALGKTWPQILNSFPRLVQAPAPATALASANATTDIASTLRETSGQATTTPNVEPVKVAAKAITQKISPSIAPKTDIAKADIQETVQIPETLPNQNQLAAVGSVESTNTTKKLYAPGIVVFSLILAGFGIYYLKS